MNAHGNGEAAPGAADASPLSPQHITLLAALLREAGAEAMLRADKLLDEPEEARPQVVGEAIALFGRDQDGVRMLYRGLELPTWLGAEIKYRAERAMTLTSAAESGL